MKPHEETWVAGSGMDRRFVFKTEAEAICEFASNDPAGDPARAVLAAQAPVMAQVLIDILVTVSKGRRTPTQDKIEGILRDAGVIP